MPPLEAWEKVLVSADFVNSTHGTLGCRACHGGPEGVLEKHAAHEEIVVDPSAGGASVCQSCHAETVAAVRKSLHATQNGYFAAFAARSGESADALTFQRMFNSRCASCHTTCGQCHVSQPVSVGGGLAYRHEFRKTPSQAQSCTACHGSRIGDEFQGRNEGIDDDVHYCEGMDCMSCHDATELHGDGTTPTHRYANDAGPSCTDCHPDADSPTADSVWHSTHAELVACQVCHSGAYKNCYSCHVEQDQDGLRFPSQLDFRIGRNPAPSAKRPYNYVVLRHVPIAPDTFRPWGIELPNYTDEPTWRLATPHNIQRNTPQTESCDTCHGNPDLFLTPAYVAELVRQGLMVAEEIKANETVIVKEPPN